MDIETRKAALIGEIDPTGADDFAIVYPDGNAPHLRADRPPIFPQENMCKKDFGGNTRFQTLS
jgi:hypothetical protein